MTLIVGLVCKGAIVLASDSRGVGYWSGTMVNVDDTYRKVFFLRGAAIGTSGDLAVGRVLVEDFTRHLESDLTSQTSLPGLAVEIEDYFGRQYHDKCSGLPVRERPNLDLLAVGYAENGTPQLFTFASAQEFLRHRCDRWACIGTPMWAYLILRQLYDDGLSVENGKILAVYLIQESSSQDKAIGGPVRIATVSPDGKYSEVSEDEVGAICRRNDGRRATMRRSFFGL